MGSHQRHVASFHIFLENVKENELLTRLGCMEDCSAMHKCWTNIGPLHRQKLILAYAVCYSIASLGLHVYNILACQSVEASRFATQPSRRALLTDQ